MKNIAILGSTGKIGTQALEIIRNYPQEFKVVSLACGHKSKLFDSQIKEFKPKITAISEIDGEKKLINIATHSDVDLVVVAVVGLAGLAPTLAAIKAKKDIALATKEVLVIAGKIVMEKVAKHYTNLIPLDSEHSAIFQCLKSGNIKDVKRIWLTMGKGPIAKMSIKQLAQVTKEQIFDRPCWSMGTKIAVDSATGINKAFEVIEAAYLFGVKPEQIEIVVHPEYLCHSLVEFVDGSIITELGTPDMKRYLQYALFYPSRHPSKLSSFIDLVGKKLSFEKPPFNKFPCLKLGFQALKADGSMPAVMHGADKSAVDAFVAGKIKFTEIPIVVRKTMDRYKLLKSPRLPKLKQLIEAEAWGQKAARQIIGGKL
jgi:1-deoxy-D-xylulose-5-phosphate reductoisomerase